MFSFVIFYCVFVGAIFTFNAFYQEIYDTPRVLKGTVDYGGTFAARYMPQYEWAVDTEAMLSIKYGE